MRKTQTKKILKFPKDFLWGAATSAYQVEGGIVNNDWANSKMPPAGLATDHYRRFEEDFHLAKKLNMNALRISLEWARVEPRENEWNEEEFDHYFHVLDTLKKLGFQTFVTLHHFTNPVWVARQGGWASRKTVNDFVGYAAKVCDKLGQYIDFWVTVNEPGIYSLFCYKDGIWPPYQKHPFRSLSVYRNMLDGHNQAYEVIHGYFPKAQVGFAQGIAFNEAFHRRSLFDHLAAWFTDEMSVDYPYRRTKNDFLGLNHYFHNRLEFRSLRASVAAQEKRVEYTEKGWEIYPRAIYEVVMRLKKYNLPIYVTENGIADSRDVQRQGYIKGYLRELHRAIVKRAPVKGYLYWSLTDTYEWPVRKEIEKTGYEMKFGLIAVDFARGLKRKVRRSAKFYAEICKTNSIELPLRGRRPKSLKAEKGLLPPWLRSGSQ